MATVCHVILLSLVFLLPSVVEIPRVKSWSKTKNYSIGGQRSEPGGKLSCKITALNHCTVTDNLWNRRAVCHYSWNLEEMLRPSSRRLTHWSVPVSWQQFSVMSMRLGDQSIWLPSWKLQSKLQLLHSHKKLGDRNTPTWLQPWHGKLRAGLTAMAQDTSINITIIMSAGDEDIRERWNQTEHTDTTTTDSPTWWHFHRRAFQWTSERRDEEWTPLAEPRQRLTYTQTSNHRPTMDSGALWWIWQQ